VVIISDFLDGLPDDPDGARPGPAASAAPSSARPSSATPAWELPLRRLATRHRVLAMEITDPRELELPDVGLITLIDPESGLRREVATGSRRLRERFAAAAAEQRRQVRQALNRAGAVHMPLRTDRDWVVDIVRHVHAQRRLAGAARPLTEVRGGLV
jgi:uncharacterized protein (DUF58 family)